MCIRDSATIDEYPNGDLVCNGRVVDGGGTADGCVLRTTANGGLLTARAYGAPGKADELYQVATTGDGGYAAIGSTKIVSGSTNAYLIKADTSGELECHERPLNLTPQTRFLSPRPHTVVHTSNPGQWYIYIRRQEPWSCLLYTSSSANAERSRNTRTGVGT